MTLLQLTEGTNTIRWSLNGYDTLEAQISISPTGTVTCLNVLNGICGTNTPPGVKVSGSTVTGYLKAAPPEANICNWITALGGWRAIAAFDIMALVSAYSGQTNLGFTVSAAHIMGAVSYYSNKSGSPASGNSLTGCSFI